MFRIFVLCIVATISAFPGDLSEKWNELHNIYQMNPNDSRFCTENNSRQVEKFRLASVTKIATSLYAIEKLGHDYRFTTRFYLDSTQTRLHIVGGGDPYFVYESLFYLIKELNKLNIKNLQRVTFDNNFYLNWSTGEDHIRDLILQVFNTYRWGEELQNIYTLTKEQISELNIPINLNNIDISLSEAYYSRNMPFQPGLSLSLSSNTLISYIKEMNLYSTNFIAEALVHHIGSITELNSYFQEKFDLPSGTFYFYTGSGLGDNFAQCDQVLQIFKAFQRTLKSNGLHLLDAMAVPQIDPGTLSDRLPHDNLSVIAKTGTLLDTSTLAGYLYTNDGLKVFLIQNNTTSILKARNLQDDWIGEIIKHFGGGLEINYEGRVFHPLMDVVVSF